MKDLTTGNVGRLILNFAMPMLLGNVFQQLYSIVDSIIVGKYLGTEALAAVGASFPMIFTLISFVIGIGSGFTIVISQYFGAKQMENVKRSIDTLYIFLLIASTLVTLIGIFFAKPILELTRLPEEVLPLAVTYLQVYFAGTITFFGFAGTSAVLRGLGDSKTPLYFLVISTLANIAFDLLFVLVFDFGVEGVAAATVISQAGAFFTLAFYLNRKHEILRINWRKYVFDRPIFKKALKIGVPTGFQQTFVALGMMALFGIVNTFGTETVAAYTIAMRIDGFAAMPAMNFAAALAAFVGQNIGANKFHRVRSGLTATFMMTAVVSLAVSLISFFFRRELIGVFTNNVEVIELGQRYLLIVSWFYIIFSSMFVVNGVMRGAGDTLIPMFITLTALWIVRVPMSYYFAGKIGIDGVWWAIPAAWGVGLGLSYIYYLTGRWRSKAVVKAG